MSRTVRRLIFDYQLLWIGLDAILFAMLVFMDWGWLFKVRSTSVVQWFVPVFSVFPGVFFVPKMPVWQALPISGAERRRALWWLWIGLPMFRVIASMALPLAVIGPLRGVHATPAQIAGLVELQLLAVLPMGALFSAGGVLRRRLGFSGNSVVMIPVFLLGVAFSWLQLAGRAELVLGAAAALMLAAASYAWTDPVAAAVARLADQAEGPRPLAGRGRLRGWAVLAPYGLSAMALAVAAAVAINYSMVVMVGPGLAEGARRRLPAQMMMTVMLLSAIGGQAIPYALRSLRTLPIGPVSLTALLQGFMLLTTIAPLGVLWAVMRVTDLETSQLPVYLAGMVPIVAMRLPVNFRVGVQAGMFVTIVPLIGLMFLPFAAWSHGPWFDAAMALAAALVWIWTWWELACGRAAYRVQPLGATRWRGGLN